jgi:hypothetical protein
MSYDCQKLTEAIKKFQIMKGDFDTKYRDGVGIDIRSATNTKEAISLDLEIILEMLPASEADAKKILGKDFLGSDAIAAALGLDAVPTKIPRIPFTREELKNVLDSTDQFLILRTENLSDFERSLFKLGNEAMENPPTTRWALVTKEPMEASFDKTYLEQTELFVRHLQERVFRDRKMPEEYADAIREFESQKAKLKSLSKKHVFEGWKNVAKRLSELKITQLCRQSHDEVLYDLVMYENANKQYLLGKNWTFTSSLHENGYLVDIGLFDDQSVLCTGVEPGFHDYELGACFVRTI